MEKQGLVGKARLNKSTKANLAFFTQDPEDCEELDVRLIGQPIHGKNETAQVSNTERFDSRGAPCDYCRSIIIIDHKSFFFI
jgi:hypothetical protein